MTAASAPAGAGSSLVRLLRDAARLDRTQSDPVVAARNAFGVAVPLAIGTLVGSASVGLAMTIGALQAAFADRPGPYRLRLLRVLGTATAAAVTSTVAVAVSGSDVAEVMVLALFAFVAGLLTVGGPSATQVGIAGVAAALILGHLHQPPSIAPHVGFLVLAGGALQAALAVAGWPLGRHRPERTALAALYRQLADAARAPRGTSSGPPAADALTSARQTLYGLGSDHGPSVEAYRVLLDEAERIRREISVLAATAERLAGAPELAESVRNALTSVAPVLDEVASALSEGRPLARGSLDPARDAVRYAVERLEAETGVEHRLTRRVAVARLIALAGQVRAAVESAGHGASEGRGTSDTTEVRNAPAWREPLENLRANLTLRSALFRHAVRLAVLVAAADAAVRAAGIDRGYWVPLTVLVVTRPDFATTWQRAVLRVVGTVVGLVVATELVHLLPGGEWWRVGLVALFAFGVRFAGPGNLALTAVCLSGLVVVLLEINGVPARDTEIGRALSTLVGGAVAVVAAVLLLPSWERRFVAPRLAELLSAYRTYLEVLADPSAGRAELQRARAACRLARSNAQASVDRAASEPVRGAREVDLGRAVLAHSHRLVHALLSLDAVRRQVRESGRLADVGEFLTEAGAVLDSARRAVEDGVPPPAANELRERWEALRSRLADEDDVTAAVIEASDRITNSLDTLVAELRRQLTPERRSEPAR